MLEVVYFAMLVRMICSFLLNVEESKIYLIAFMITEPFIIPVRLLMVKLNIGQNSPIDWSFFITSIILSIVTVFLPIM